MAKIISDTWAERGHPIYDEPLRSYSPHRARAPQVEERFSAARGWLPSRQTRIWETSPKIRQYQGAVVPILSVEATKGILRV